MRKPYLILACLTAALGLGVVLAHRAASEPPDPRVLPDSAVDESVTYSNILPADYVGPETCAKCHPSHHARWSTHPHSVMNRMATREWVKGDFDAATVDLPGGEVRFTTEPDGTYHMSVYKGGELHRRYQVTRTVGSRRMQFYIGQLTFGPEPAGDPIRGEHMLPFSYWFKMGRWLPRQYFDPDGDEKLVDGVPQIEAIHRRPDVRPYQQVCMNCHNTFPYAYRMFHESFAGFPDAQVQAALGPLSDALAADMAVEPTVDSFLSIRSRMDPGKDFVTMGISCESCHFGGREHALHEQQIRFVPTSKFIRLAEQDPARRYTPDRHNPVTVLGVCVQCHSGQGRLYPNGAAKGNSREGLDMHAGFCTSELRCVDCHDPHKPSEPVTAAVLAGHADTCVKCHDEYADPRAAAAHTRHAPADANCLDCHMPRYTQGLDELVHSHRISHPVEEVMVAAGSANACNTCHLDRSVRWTLTELEKGWGRRIAPNPEWPSYSRLDEPAGPLWLHGADNHLRLVAGQCYARSPLGKEMLPELIESLNDPEPLNRVFHSCAVQRVLGRAPSDPLDVDITGPPADRRRQIERLLRELVTGD